MVADPRKNRWPCATWHVGYAARQAGDRDRRRLEGHVRNRARVPAHVEEALGVDRLLVTVAIDVLGDAEGNVGHVDDRQPLREEDIEAPAEGSDEPAQVEFLGVLRFELEAGSEVRHAFAMLVVALALAAECELAGRRRRQIVDKRRLVQELRVLAFVRAKDARGLKRDQLA